MNILVTGGAGFIGSNLVGHLLSKPEVTKVRVLDNLATGFEKNILAFLSHPKFEFLQGDIRSAADCANACDGMDMVSHQAALGSVPRSIQDPIGSHEVNVNGFVNMLNAARHAGIKRFVYASSSSVYGNLKESPKVETRVGKVLSPYAATKATNELYAEAFARNYGMTCVGFRYFNVFGPKQDPDGPYAAVIPLFIKAALTNTPPIINGDGTITRDFTPVEHVVNANWNALIKELEAPHEVFNVACGQTTTLNELWEMIREAAGASVKATHGPNRAGDILHSLADVSKLYDLLHVKFDLDMKTELKKTVDYYRTAH